MLNRKSVSCLFERRGRKKKNVSATNFAPQLFRYGTARVRNSLLAAHAQCTGVRIRAQQDADGIRHAPPQPLESCGACSRAQSSAKPCRLGRVTRWAKQLCQRHDNECTFYLDACMHSIGNLVACTPMQPRGGREQPRLPGNMSVASVSPPRDYEGSTVSRTTYTGSRASVAPSAASRYSEYDRPAVQAQWPPQTPYQGSSPYPQPLPLPHNGPAFRLTAPGPQQLPHGYPPAPNQGYPPTGGIAFGQVQSSQALATPYQPPPPPPPPPVYAQQVGQHTVYHSSVPAPPTTQALTTEPAPSGGARPFRQSAGPTSSRPPPRQHFGDAAGAGAATTDQGETSSRRESVRERLSFHASELGSQAPPIHAASGGASTKSTMRPSSSHEDGYRMSKVEMDIRGDALRRRIRDLVTLVGDQ